MSKKVVRVGVLLLFSHFYPFLIAFSFLGIASFLYSSTRKKWSVDLNSVELSQFVFEGILAYFKRSLSAILQIAFYSLLVLFAGSHFFHYSFTYAQILAFILGIGLSIGGAFLSLILIPHLVPRLIHASTSFLKIGFDTVYGVAVAVVFFYLGLMLLGLSTVYFLLGPTYLMGFGVGVAYTTFFLRIGGGVFKNTTTFGLLLIRKREGHLAHFDARNPMSIVMMMGDFIGKITGYSSDLILSFCLAGIAAVFLVVRSQTFFMMMSLPIFIFAIGMASACVAVGICRLRIMKGRVGNILLEGIYASVGLGLIGTWLYIQYDAISIDRAMTLFFAYVSGVLGAVVLGFGSDYLTSHAFSPSKKLASQSEYGVAFVFLDALSGGFKSVGLFFVGCLVVMGPSYLLAGLYGVAIATVGMVSATASVLVVMTFGPLATHAQRVSSLSDHSEVVHKNIRFFARVGNSTGALGHAFMAGSAALACVSLFLAIGTAVKGGSGGMWLGRASGMGLCIGSLMPFIFLGFLIKGLLKTVKMGVTEVVRQFRDIPYLIEGKAKPDIRTFSDLLARYSMDSLIVPGIIMVLGPVLSGLLLGYSFLLGFLLGNLLAGLGIAFVMANVGESLNSARFYVEQGHFGGKESPTYHAIEEAAAIGDVLADVVSSGLTVYARCLLIVAVHMMVLLRY